MISPQFRPLTGGYERAAERLSRRLAARGHEVTVITERRQDVWPRAEELDGFRVRRLWCIYRRGLHSLTALFSFAGWLISHGRSFQIWHVHQYGMHGTLSVLLGKLLRRLVVLKVTSSGTQGLEASLLTLRAAALHTWAHRRIAACIAVSEETALEALAFGIPRARIHTISNGVDTEAFHPPTTEEREAARQSLGIAAGFVAIAVGRVAAVKNPLGMLQAWAEAIPSLPHSAKLIWVGDGPLRREVDLRISKLGLTGRVMVAGHCENVSKWLAAADAFVLPSHNEGMANALLEAMACGLPSVTTAVSGTSQLLAKTGAGIVVPTGDMTALAAALVKMASDSEARQLMGLRAREIVERAYSLSAICSQIEALYAEISLER